MAFLRPSGAAIVEAHTGLNFVMDNLAYDAATRQLFFPDPSVPGVHVFDAVTDARLTTTAVPVGGLPIDLAVARGSAVDAPALPAAAGSGPLSRAAPNPAFAATTIRLSRPAGRVRAASWTRAAPS
jgi:hypothetical protein